MTNKQIVIISVILFCLGVTCILFSGNTKSNTYTVNKELLENYDNGNNVLMHYPRLQSDEDDYSAVNALILQGVSQAMYDFYGEQITDLSLEIDYRIVRQDEKLFSVIFEGVGYVAQTAHPNNHLFTLNLDLAQGTRLTLSEFYKINSEFVQILIERLVNQNSDVEETFSSYTENEVLLMLVNADQAGQSAFSYITDNAIGISLPIAHAAGDHVEAEIKFKDLRDFEMRTLD